MGPKLGWVRLISVPLEIRDALDFLTSTLCGDRLQDQHFPIHDATARFGVPKTGVVPMFASVVRFSAENFPNHDATARFWDPKTGVCIFYANGPILDPEISQPGQSRRSVQISARDVNTHTHARTENPTKSE